MNENAKIGKYHVVRVIGEGGMGRVYEATDPVIGRRVAIKVISLGVNTPDARARFFREAQAAGCLSHPNIITIHDIGGEVNESPHIVMEFLDGTDLSHQLVAGGLSIEKKIQIAVDICEGLAHAHAQGIVHRDIKPANIMITTRSATANACAARFRSRRAANVAATRRIPNMVVGTPNYMAPEQTVPGETVDARADIYSVGVVLYELLAGASRSPATRLPRRSTRCCRPIRPSSTRSTRHCRRRCRLSSSGRSRRTRRNAISTSAICATSWSRSGWARCTGNDGSDGVHDDAARRREAVASDHTATRHSASLRTASLHTILHPFVHASRHT